MTIWRGEGGGGDATTDSEINLITALANSVVADTAITTAAAASATASASEALTSASNAATSATNADLSAIASAASAAASLSSANNSASSAAAALVSENAAAASAASVNDTNLVHITGTETITGTKTFSNTITGSITGNSGTVTNGVYTSGDQTITGNKTFSSSIIGSITGNAATATTAASCSGNAATVTDGVYTTSDQTIGGKKTFSNTILGSISGATGVFTGDIQSASQNGGQLAGLRNKIINGNMGIAQRGTAAVTVSGNYGPADRWTTSVVGDTFSTSQGTFVSGDTLYDTGGTQYFTQVGVTSVANAANFANFQQRIEDVRLLAGQTVTVSFWAKGAGTGLTIGLEIAQSFGTGGSPSAQVTGTGQAQLLTTSWAKYSKTFIVPSINGKTIGTDANSSYTQLIFWLDAGANFATRSGTIGQASKTVSIAQVQLEIGTVATPFEQRPYGMELALCQRYLPSGNAGAGWAYALNSAQYLFPFAVLPRVAPTGVTVITHATLSSTGTAQTSNSAVFAGAGSQSSGLLNLSSAANFAAATGQGSTCSQGNYLFTGCEL